MISFSVRESANFTAYRFSSGYLRVLPWVLRLLLFQKVRQLAWEFRRRLRGRMAPQSWRLRVVVAFRETPEIHGRHFGKHRLDRDRNQNHLRGVWERKEEVSCFVK